MFLIGFVILLRPPEGIGDWMEWAILTRREFCGEWSSSVFQSSVFRWRIDWNSYSNWSGNRAGTICHISAKYAWTWTYFPMFSIDFKYICTKNMDGTIFKAARLPDDLEYSRAASDRCRPLMTVGFGSLYGNY